MTLDSFKAYWQPTTKILQLLFRNKKKNREQRHEIKSD